MFLPLFIAFVSVALGALVAWVPGWAHRAIGPIRTFAMVSASTVVLVHLLPGSLAAIGPVALIGLLAGIFGPSLLEKLFSLSSKGHAHHHEDCGTIATEIGYTGLLVHCVGDGVGLWAYAGAGHAHADVALALAAHNVPVTALMVLRFMSSSGPRAALLRAIGLTVACMAGVLIAATTPGVWIPAFEPWIAAIVSGLLLHVISHGLLADPPKTSWSRTVDLSALLIGLAVPLMGMSVDETGSKQAALLSGQFSSALLDLTLETAPVLLLGLCIGALIQVFGHKLSLTRFIRGGNTVSQALRGAFLGAPLPLCACGILPVTRSLQLRGAKAAFAVSFLLTTPELGVETLTLTGQLLGWPFAFYRLAVAVAIGFVAALVVSALLTRYSVQPDTALPSRPPTYEKSNMSYPDVWRRYWTALDELLRHIGPWVLIGVLVAAYLQVAVSNKQLLSMSRSGLDVLLVTAIAIPGYVCASSATPLAAVLIAKGLSPGAALVGLILGPATNVTTVAFLQKSYGRTAAMGSLTAVLVITWFSAWLLNLVPPLQPVVTEMVQREHSYGWVAVVSTVTFGLIGLRSIWQYGVRAWLASVMTQPDHDHLHSYDVVR